jgi:hypothetical protein
VEWREAIAYHNMIDSGMATPYSFGEMNQRSYNWVTRVYDYINIRNEVRVAEAA